MWGSSDLKADRCRFIDFNRLYRCLTKGSVRRVDKGTLIEFRQGADRRLAVLDRPEGKKHWIAIDERGQSHTLHPRQISYEVKGETYLSKDIARFQAAVEPYLDPSALEVAWEFWVEEGGMTTPNELAEFLFSAQEPEQCYAAYVLLSDDRLYFKQRKDSYEPRSVAQVAELRHQQEVETQRQTQWQGFLERVDRALAIPATDRAAIESVAFAGTEAEAEAIEAVAADRAADAAADRAPALNGAPTPSIRASSVQWEDSDRPWLEALENFATFGEEAKHRAAACDLLTHLQRSDSPEAALSLLVDLGLWQPHENLFLRRSQIPTHFAQKVLDVTHILLQNPPVDPDPDRSDLTHLKTYTVDDESTLEIDDGLSVEILPEGQERLWIHIADPTRWVTPGDTLELEARRRSTTLYLPTGMVPMFPKELATGPMSLVQGQRCCALSFGVILTEEGAILDYCIQPSLIQPTYRLTYEDVDEMLELDIQAEAELATLYKWTKIRQKWRQSQGAITIRMPEASIKVSASEEITIEVLEESASRQLVAEMMILAGEVAGHYGQSHDLALPFRNQPQPELPPEEELYLLPPGPVRDCAIRRCMPRSEVSLTPARHASLGLATYTQVTSPIRRYSDLLAHFQIKAHLRGDEPPFTPEQMQELLLTTSSASYEATLVERQTNRYWGLEYLRRQGNQVWPALVLRWLREHENLALVLLEDLGLELATRFDRTVRLGDKIHLRVSHVDPRRDVIQFQQVFQDAAMQSVS